MTSTRPTNGQAITQATQPGTALLRLLGPPELRRGEAVLALRRKERALLAYLAASRQPVLRSTLAMLLCPLADDPAATLRLLLTRIRGQLGATALRAEGDAVALNPDAVWIDLLAFEQLHGAAAGATAEALSAAADLYRGPFLDGLALADAPEFELWAISERARLQQRYEQILQALLTLASERANLQEAIRRAQQLTRVNPLHDAAHAQLIRLYAQAGQRAAAIAQFETYRRLLADELGAAPDPELAALRAALSAAPPDHARPLAAVERGLPPAAPPPHNVPAALTSFVGREKERAQIAALLADPVCRLLTITGPGGVGKTRLALEVARAETRLGALYHDGVYLVALAPLKPSTVEVPDPDALAVAIAAAIGLPLSGATPPAEQLLRAIRDRAMLLILDNFEQLVASAGLVGDLLAVAPGVRCVVASRERLNLYGEWVVELEGLACPPADDDAAAAAYPGVELFAQRARLVDRHFDLAAALPHVAHICRALSGLPLGIELAAARLRDTECAELARALDRSLDVLTGAARNTPPRHHSLRAVFDYSWGLLSADERASFARLTVFDGSFTAEAAARVAEIGPQMLARLADVSLVQRGAAGRYDIHPMLRQFGAERLADAPAVRGRHMRWYAELARRHERALLNGDPAAIAATGAEVDNLRAAWREAVAYADQRALGDLLDTFAMIGELRGWLLESRGMLVQARSALVGAGAPNELLMGRIGLWLARFYEQLAEYEAARAHAADSMRCFERVGATALVARAGVVLGSALHALGDNPAALRQLEQSLAVFRALGDRAGQAEALYCLYFPYAWSEQDGAAAARCVEESLRLSAELGDRRGLARCYYVLGNARLGAGAFHEALEHYAESRRLSELLGDVVGQANCLKNQGIAAQYLGQFAEARRTIETSRALFARTGDQRGVANSLYNLGTVAADEADLDVAQAYFERSLALYRSIGRPAAEAVVLGALGGVVAARGEVEQARGYLRRALSIGTELGSAMVLVMACAEASALLATRGAADIAARALALATRHDAADVRTKARASRELQRLGAHLAPDRLAHLADASHSPSLKELAAAVLAAL